MNYTGYELIWLFFVYSFLGWILETTVAATKHKKFVNKGLINGPFCILYGVGASIVTIFCHELYGFWLFVASFILTTVVEWIAGHAIGRFYHEKWWDYSSHKFNIDGYISLSMSLIWAVLCTTAVTWVNPLLTQIFQLFPLIVGTIIVWALMILLAVDVTATLIVLSGRSKYIEQWQNVDDFLTEVTVKLGDKVSIRINRRIDRAYPEASKKEKAEAHPEIFAYGCSFTKIFWLFVIGCVLGDLVETLYCYSVGGVWMSRSSLVWGPFSIVWGFAIALATLLLYHYRDRSWAAIFAIGTFLGGAYEYICSVLTELVFGKVFWDYSSMPFNLGGRINLLYCFFWGIAAAVWIKLLYPVFSGWIEKIPLKIGKVLTVILVVFMCSNMLVSALALIRSDQRNHGVEATSFWQEILDERFDDARLQRIYPNAIVVKK